MGHIIKGLKGTIPWLWMAAVEPVLRAPNKYARLKVGARTPQKFVRWCGTSIFIRFSKLIATYDQASAKLGLENTGPQRTPSKVIDHIKSRSSHDSRLIREPSTPNTTYAPHAPLATGVQPPAPNHLTPDNFLMPGNPSRSAILLPRK